MFFWKELLWIPPRACERINNFFCCPIFFARYPETFNDDKFALPSEYPRALLDKRIRYIMLKILQVLLISFLAG